MPSTFTVYEGTTLVGYALFDKGEVKLQPNKLSSDKAAKLLDELSNETLPARYRLKPLTSRASKDLR
jgi:hypothetical protein